MKRTNLHHLWLFAFLLSAWGAAAFGQSTTGQITGRITDPSGAVVQTAKVNVTNVSTGIKRESSSNEEGYYTVPLLQPGDYRIDVQQPGFKAVSRSGIKVNVDQVLRIDFIMEVGEVTETIDVTSSPPQLQSGSSDIGTTVDAATILDLPLAVGGTVRNPLEFIKLVPGFSGTINNDPGSNSTVFKFNGGQENATDVLVDGATIQLVSPSIQMNYGVSVEGVQEFKVQTNNFGAEYGRTSAGIVNLILKSGTNRFHGTGYNFLRNRVLDANSWFNNRSGTRRPIDTQNDFGFLVSGPVLKDRTFFMFDYEGFRFNTGGASLRTYPTDAQKAGNFSALLPGTVIYDPATCNPGPCQPFPGNIIPASRISSVSRNVLGFLPQTSTALANNVVETSQGFTKADLWTLKIDHQLTTKQKIAGSMSVADTEKGNTSNLGDISGGSLPQRTRYFRFSHDYVLSPALLNHFNYGFSRRFRQELSNGLFQDYPRRLGLNGVAQTTFPCIRWVGFGEGINNCGDSDFADNTYQLNDNLSWIKGRHTLKFGFEVRQQQFNTRRLTETSGRFQFDAPQTSNGMSGGHSFASFLLGQVSRGDLNLGRSQGIRFGYYAGFAQDDFKVTPKLTLNYGFRYELPVPASEAHDRFSVVDPSLPNPGAGNLLGAYTFFGEGPGRNGRKRPQDTYKKSYGPRFGFAYEWTPDTVIRGGYGIYYSALKEGSFADNDSLGFFGQAGFSSPGGVAPAFNWDGGFPQNFPHPPFIDPTVGNGGSNNIIIVPRDTGRPGLIQNWNLNIQRQLGKDLLLDVAYVGSKGDHLVSLLRIPNQLNPILQSKGACLSVNINQQSADPACAGQALVAKPYPSFSGTVAQALRPFPQYGNFNQESNSFSPERGGSFTYHAMQLKLEKRFSQGLTFLASYTVSKNITNADSEAPGGAGFLGNNAFIAQNSFDPKSEKGLSQLDTPQSLVFSYTYELPVGPGKAYGNKSGAAGKLLQGWRIGAVHTYRSGIPTAAFACGVNTGVFALDQFTGCIRANVVPGANQQGWSGNFDPTTDRFFNPAAFSVPANFTFGNAPRSLNLRSFPTLNEDFTIGKRTQITEDVHLDFRTEFFNVFNRHIFNAPGVFAGGNRNDPASFGVVNSSSGPRIIQFGLKLNF
ncbi:MAG: TonB-dependent receptor [Acidobacteria bacterium]|nr:TonB-dependent receptor [Acidobacteriota bacterium]